MGRKDSYLLVDDSDNATKIAFIEDGRLAEFWQKEDGHELGEVHLARVLHTHMPSDAQQASCKMAPGLAGKFRPLADWKSASWQK